MQPIFKESQEIGGRNFGRRAYVTAGASRKRNGALPLATCPCQSNNTIPPPRPSGQGWLRRRQCV